MFNGKHGMEVRNGIAISQCTSTMLWSAIRRQDQAFQLAGFLQRAQTRTLTSGGVATSLKRSAMREEAHSPDMLSITSNVACWGSHMHVACKFLDVEKHWVHAKTLHVLTSSACVGSARVAPNSTWRMRLSKQKIYHCQNFKLA